MLPCFNNHRKFSGLSVLSLFALLLSIFPATEVQAKKGGAGIIKGFVRDNSGNPIGEAVIAVFTIGRTKLLKQVRSDSDGSFLARVIPGTYTVLAVAQGFNPQTVREVQVNRATELNYGFNLERAGNGNTLPEKKADRISPKSVIRAAQSRRSIYQNQEGRTIEVEEKEIADEAISEAKDEAEEESAKRKSQTLVETYFADSGDGAFQGLNFATLQPINENAEIIFVGQTGTNQSAPQRLEAALKYRPNDKHQLRFSASTAKISGIKNATKPFGQISVSALDEWKVREGIILVLGLDYSRFVGASDDSAISPRFGLQFDADSKTRFRTAFTTATEEQSWRRAVELEESTVAFRDQITSPVVAVEDGKAKMNKSRRLEFGVERILDSKSSIEATAFFDTVSSRGVGLANLPFEMLNGETNFVANQQGNTQGVRVVYSRRINGTFSTSAGYSLGKGQKLSSAGITNPAKIFVDDFFQSFVGQINADLSTGTKVKTIIRFSPDATIFAIDPFQGRLAIYDPSLSILVTQNLPTLGLPIRAEAVIDARNILDYQTSATGEEGTLRLNSQRRILRGGISVRF